MMNELQYKVNALNSRLERLEARLEDAIDLGRVKLANKIRTRIDEVQLLLDEATEDMQAQSEYNGWDEWSLNGIRESDFI
ncbi:hypothetical protein [Phage f2b1]|nr:hypothetical protein [Phage f2b1]